MDASMEIEEEPDDLGEYSRPLVPQRISSSRDAENMGEGTCPRAPLPASGGGGEQQDSSKSTAADSRPSSKGKEAAHGAAASPARGGSQLSRHADSAGASIVYAPTRNDVENIAAKLKSLGLAAEAYHAGLKPAHLARVMRARSLSPSFSRSLCLARARSVACSYGRFTLVS
jgi:hypothetical protein